MKLWLIKFPYWLGIAADALWAVRRPIERRFVILLTALVVAALFLLALVNVLKGNTNEYWILIKCLVLFVAMLTSFSLAELRTHRLRIERDGLDGVFNNQSDKNDRYA